MLEYESKGHFGQIADYKWFIPFQKWT